MRSGRPRGPWNVFQNAGGEALIFLMAFPGPRGRPDFKNASPKGSFSLTRLYVEGFLFDYVKSRVMDPPPGLPQSPGLGESGGEGGGVLVRVALG